MPIILFVKSQGNVQLFLCISSLLTGYVIITHMLHIMSLLLRFLKIIFNILLGIQSQTVPRLELVLLARLINVFLNHDFT